MHCVFLMVKISFHKKMKTDLQYDQTKPRLKKILCKFSFRSFCESFVMIRLLLPYIEQYWKARVSSMLKLANGISFLKTWMWWDIKRGKQEQTCLYSPIPSHIVLMPTNIPSRTIDTHSSSMPNSLEILFLIRKAKQAFPFSSLIFSNRSNEEYAIGFEN